MSIFGQVWVFSAIAFVLGAFLAWVFLVRPARKRIRTLEERLVAREADLRRISEPALGAAGTAQTRTERGDPFSDADEALAGTGAYSVGADVDAPDRPEPETSWLERDSLPGDYAGGYTAEADDFDLADRQDDLDIPDDRGAYDADHDAGHADGYRAFVADDDYGDYGRSTPGAIDDTGIAADDAARRSPYDGRDYDGRDYDGPDYDGPGYDEAADERTHYVAADRGVADDLPVSSVLDPDEMRSGPDAAGLDGESTRLIGPDVRPDAGDAPALGSPEQADSGTAGFQEASPAPASPDSAADETDTSAGSALHPGAPFRPVTSFDATTELPVGAIGEDGLHDPSAGVGGANGTGTAVPDDPRERNTVSGGADDDGEPATRRSERAGSLFEPTPAGEDGKDDSGAGQSDTGDSIAGEPVAAGGGANSFGTGEPASGGPGEAPADPPAYAFGGPDAAPDEDPAESTNILPKRTPRQRPPGGFDAPKPIQPSMRSITRREPDAAAQSGSLFEPTSPGASASLETAGEPATDAVHEPGQPSPDSRQPTKFAAPSGQVPTGGDAVSDQPAANVSGMDRAGGGPETGASGSADPSETDAPKAGPFGPGSAMPLPGGGSPSPEFTVKASVTALRYVTDAAPQYPRMVAEVWFRSPADAERVGFRPLS